MELALPADAAVEQIHALVIRVAEMFKDLVENGHWWTHLYNDDGKRKKEQAAQLLFFGIADQYCRANDLDLSPEVDSGRGRVDFKISRGYFRRVLAETKLTSNPNLIHGYEVQLAEYLKAEKTRRGVYIVIDVTGGSEERLTELRRVVTEAKQAHVDAPDLIVIDGRPKASASHYGRNG
jgi:hypothetical protein